MKDTRINIRMPAAEKELWETTAREYGMSTTEFVVRSVRTSIMQLNHAKTGNTSTTSNNSTFQVVSWTPHNTTTS